MRSQVYLKSIKKHCQKLMTFCIQVLILCTKKNIYAKSQIAKYEKYFESFIKKNSIGKGDAKKNVEE